MADLRIRMRSIRSSSSRNYTDIFNILSNNDYKYTYNDTKWPNFDDDTIKDGTEDANHNGKIDGDNGDGVWTSSEIWTELNPNAEDTDGDTFSDNDEKTWGYNPLSIDTDGDGLADNVEDSSNFGTKDATETSVTNSDTDGDGLSDKMEKDGWTVIIIYEATLEIKEERVVDSNPLIADYDGDGINDCIEFEYGTDPNDPDTDDDGFNDKVEIDNDYGSSPTGIDGKAPTISDFDCEYALRTETSGPLWNIKISMEYIVKIWISAYDIFGLEWVNVHLEGVGDVKIYTGDVTSFEDEKFEFSLSFEKAMSSLFNSFEVNITGSDQNRNIGYKEENIPSIKDIVIEIFEGALNHLCMVLTAFISLIVNGIIEIIRSIIYQSGIIVENVIEVIPINIVIELINIIYKRIEFIIDVFIDIIIISLDIITTFIVKTVNSILGYDILKKEYFTKDYIMNIITSFINDIRNYLVEQIRDLNTIIENNPIIKYLLDLSNDIINFSYQILTTGIDEITMVPIYIINKLIEANSLLKEGVILLQDNYSDVFFEYFWFGVSILSLVVDVTSVVTNLLTAVILCETVYGTLIYGAITLFAYAGFVVDLFACTYFWGDWMGDAFEDLQSFLEIGKGNNDAYDFSTDLLWSTIAPAFACNMDSVPSFIPDIFDVATYTILYWVGIFGIALDIALVLIGAMWMVLENSGNRLYDKIDVIFECVISIVDKVNIILTWAKEKYLFFLMLIENIPENMYETLEEINKLKPFITNPISINIAIT